MSDAPSQTRGDHGRFQRLAVRGHRGISYRQTATGRSYSVYSQRRYVPAGTTLEEAKAVQAELRGRGARGERVIVPPKVTFTELSEQWLEAKAPRLASWTKLGYEDALRLVLLPRFGGWQVAAIDADAVARLVRDLERDGLHAIDPKRPRRPLSPSRISNLTKPLSGTLALAVRRGVIASNPFRDLTVDERPRQQAADPAHEWSEEEIEALLSASAELAGRRDAKADYTPLLKTAVYTGLRLGELLGLQWQDIDFEEAVLHVQRQWTRTHELTPPKTESGVRRVPLTPEMVALLRRHKLASKHSGEEDFVFASKTGTPLRHRNVQRRAFEAARDLAGLPPTLTFHDLRHAFASRCAHRGVPIHTLSAVIGHRDISVTQKVYVHLFAREAAEDAFREAMGLGV